MKGQYIRSSYNNRKYFTLGGCLVLKDHYIQAMYNNRKYFTLGGAEQIYCLMDIEKYFVGSLQPVQVSFQVPTTSMC